MWAGLGMYKRELEMMSSYEMHFIPLYKLFTLGFDSKFKVVFLRAEENKKIPSLSISLVYDW